MGIKMSGKWKKIIWALLMLQLCILHVFLLQRIEYKADYYWYRVCVKINLPYAFYQLGFTFVVLLVFSVSIIMAAVFFIRYRKFRVQCIQEIVPVEEENIRLAYEKACGRAGIEEIGRKTIYRSARAASPFVLGFYRPILLLPEWINEEDELELLFFHECMHIRHKDTWYKLFLFLCNAVCWYNPLAYFIRSISVRDIEIDCDKTAVLGCGEEERAFYGQFLVDSLRRMKEKEYAYSAFFSGNEKMMKARIAAIMEDKGPYDALARGAVGLLIMETALVLCFSAKKYMEEYKAQAAPENIYEGYEKPECFTEEALDKMLDLAPANEDAYRLEMWEIPYQEVEDYSDLPYKSQGPWQVRLKDAAHYADSVNLLVYRYLNYDRDQIKASAVSFEDGGYSPIQTVYFRLLAGNQQEFVFGAVLREYWAETEEEAEIKAEDMPSFARLVKTEGCYYAYYPLAVHVKMVEDSVFELQGVVALDEALEAFKENYPDTDYSDVPYFVGKPEYEKNMAYEVRTGNGILEMKKKEASEWETVPVSLEELFTRGDEMDGALTRLQEGSYQCDEKKQIFAYGGARDYTTETVIPVKVVYYDEAAGGYKHSVVTEDYSSVRRLFISFPENETAGYLLLTSDRTVWQEATSLFVTMDGGKTWEECVPEAGGELMIHSLTTDMSFLTEKTGFITIRDSEKPDVIRTEDGGHTWEKVSFDEIPEYYSMAYAPFMENGKLTMDVGMEGYSEDGGLKARYVSEDFGANWEFQRVVLKQ